VTKDYCAGCGLHRQACFCEQIPRLGSELNLSLITHPREIQRSSNTGKLLLAAMPRSRRLIWQRGEPLEFDPSEAAVLLYPYQIACEYRLKQNLARPKLTERVDINRHFIVIDGTWQEAHKIYRQSPVLQQLDILQLPERRSQYQLRRNQQAGNLSTIEAVAAIFSSLGWSDNAKALMECQAQFARYYQASLSGHSL